jgi:hypothetical protein
VLIGVGSRRRSASQAIDLPSDGGVNLGRLFTSKAKKAIADYKKAIGRPEGLAELSIFYCEEAVCFLESCSMEDESYFAALIRMYGRSLEFVSSLPPAERATYLDRLDKLRSRGRHIGWGVEEELDNLWYAAALDEHQG